MYIITKFIQNYSKVIYHTVIVYGLCDIMHLKGLLAESDNEINPLIDRRNFT